MNKYVIKMATLDNAEQIFALTKKCFLHYQHQIGQNSTLDALSESILDVKKDIEDRCVYICLLGEKIVGSARVHDVSKNLELTRFGVDPAMQSKGIGGLIIDRIAEDFSGTDIQSISLFTASSLTSSIGFYKKHGFEIVSTTEDRGYERAQLMRKLK